MSKFFELKQSEKGNKLQGGLWAYFSNSSYVLFAVVLAKPQILIQPEANVIAIETIGREAEM